MPRQKPYCGGDLLYKYLQDQTLLYVHHDISCSTYWDSSPDWQMGTKHFFLNIGMSLMNFHQSRYIHFCTYMYKWYSDQKIHNSYLHWTQVAYFVQNKHQLKRFNKIHYHYIRQSSILCLTQINDVSQVPWPSLEATSIEFTLNLIK